MLDLGSITTRARWLGVAALALACLWIAFDARSCVGQHQVGHAVQVADQHHEAAIIHAAQGDAYDHQVNAQQVPVQEAAAEVARLRAEVARLRKATAAPPVAPVGPGAPDPQPVVPGVDLAPLVAQQDALIAAQDNQIRALGNQVATLTLARDAWRQSAQASAAEAVQLRAALAAKDGLIEAAYRRGLRTGLMIGGASGFGGGSYFTWRAMR